MKNQVITGWKDIAGFLGVSPDLAQRFEKKAGLPVTRKLGKVMTTSRKLLTWAETSVKNTPVAVKKGQ